MQIKDTAAGNAYVNSLLFGKTLKGFMISQTENISQTVNSRRHKLI